MRTFELRRFGVNGNSVFLVIFYDLNRNVNEGFLVQSIIFE